MRCKHCSSSFRISTWILACGECKDHYCTKCMKRINGIYYCENCTVLITRPPDLNELMKLKSKYLQEYLKRHDIPTRGVVEKRELALLLCSRAIPVRNTKLLNSVCHKICTSVETVFSPNTGNSRRSSPEASPTSEQGPVRPPRANRPPAEEPQRPFIYTSGTSSVNINVPSENLPQTSEGPHTLPKQSKPPRPSAPPHSEATTSTVVCEPSPLPTRFPKLTDFESVEEFLNLSPKELKILLNFNRVDYKGCVEKSELLEKAQNLWMDNRRQRTDLPDNVEDLCKLCMDAPLDCVLLECGHIAACLDCGKKLAECPICRRYVTRVVRIFKA